MYLLAQIWWLLLLAFLLGALVGYVVWRACGMPRLRSEDAAGQRELLDRIEALDKDNARLDNAARDAESKAQRNGADRAASAASAVKPTESAATTQSVPHPAIKSAIKPAAAAPPSAQPSAPAPELSHAPVIDRPRIGFLDQPQGGKADNLKLIRGIGPRLEKTLNAMGVYHFDQIAGWTADDLAIVDSRLGDFAGRAVRDKWIEQSRKLQERMGSAEDQGHTTP